jgi:hypothetical protein
MIENMHEKSRKNTKEREVSLYCSHLCLSFFLCILITNSTFQSLGICLTSHLLLNSVSNLSVIKFLPHLKSFTLTLSGSGLCF